MYKLTPSNKKEQENHWPTLGRPFKTPYQDSFTQEPAKGRCKEIVKQSCSSGTA